MDGRSRTEAAHETGFADSAHLSRTFRQMFGISPAMLIREKRWSIKEIDSGTFGFLCRHLKSARVVGLLVFSGRM
jgi:AraC-like DNA-binding protein